MKKEQYLPQRVHYGTGNQILRRPAASTGKRLTGRVPADVADVLLGDALLQQPHAHAVLPAEALFTLPENTGALMTTGLLTTKTDKSPSFHLAMAGLWLPPTAQLLFHTMTQGPIYDELPLGAATKMCLDR